MTLKLYNTRTRQKEIFTPLDPEKGVRMYVCGPTVYDLAHIGNGRALIVFDMLFRLLRELYGPDQVTYARNITDVDDKINARAREEGISIRELTERTTKQLHEDVAGIGCLPPTIEPRATDHIAEMIVLNERLIARGHAYTAEGHVLFHVPSDPNYGKLAKRSLDEMQAGARVDVAPYKRDAMDFVLWKPSHEGEPGWDSPWGYGRPGWHLECSAMSEKHLGEVFDIHGGGVDLVFPHHENEVAQSTCAHGTEIMANIWMHNGFLQVEGEKMSKSLGNFVTIHELVQKWPSEVIRLAMLSTHYRQPLDWTEEKVQQARTAIIKFSRLLQAWKKMGILETLDDVAYPEKFMEAMQDDLNTAAAITALHELDAELRQCVDVGPDQQRRVRQLAKAFALLGLEKLEDFEIRMIAFQEAGGKLDTARVTTLIDARNDARKAKNWAEADRIRDELIGLGVALKDAKDPATGQIVTTWELAR